MEHVHSANTLKNTINKKLAECLAVSSHVSTLKHKVKQRQITQKWLFQLLQQTNKQLLLGNVPLLNFVF